MRAFLLILAIVLLPLRGWTGDAMMLAPLQQAAAGHAMHSTEAHAASTGTDHGAMHDGAHSLHADDTHAHATCDTCQFCHSVAMTAWPESPMPAAAPRHAPAAQTIAFASAEAAPGFKPPIS